MDSFGIVASELYDKYFSFHYFFTSGGTKGGGAGGGATAPPVGEPQPPCRGKLLNLSGKSDIKMKN